MNLALDIFTVSAVSAGAFFFLAGTVGLLRFLGLSQRPFSSAAPHAAETAALAPPAIDRVTA